LADHAAAAELHRQRNDGDKASGKVQSGIGDVKEKVKDAIDRL